MITYETLCPVTQLGQISKLIMAEGEERFGDKFDPNLFMLVKMAEHGGLKIFVAKLQGEIIGFTMFSVAQDLFRASARVAETIAVYIVPEQRGGVYFKNLLQFSYKILKNLDKVTEVRATVNNWPKFEKFYTRAGFERLDVIMSKEI